jgi:hypothetical protein
VEVIKGSIGREACSKLICSHLTRMLRIAGGDVIDVIYGWRV